MVAGRFTLARTRESTQRSSDCFASAKARNGCIACYNSQFPCPSSTYRRFATSCRIVIPCCWWMQSLELEEDRIVGIKNVTVNEPFFVGHFPEFPVMPGVLVVEAMAQVAGVLVLKSIPDRKNKLVLLASIEEAKFRQKVRARRPTADRNEGHAAQGECREDARPGHRGRFRGGRGDLDVRLERPRARSGLSRHGDSSVGHCRSPGSHRG